MSEQVGTPAAPQSEPSGAKQVGKSIGKRIIGYVVVLAVVGLGGLAWKYFSGDVSTAKVGDCITNTVKADASDAKVVDCTKPEAKNKVVGILTNSHSEAEFQASDNPCEAYPTAENAIWIGKKTGKGDVWCLEPIAAK